jgi:hypothetical protein
LHNHDLLKSKFHEPDKDEGEVVLQIWNGVQVFWINISAVELVKEWHQENNMEDESVHLQSHSAVSISVS